LDRMDGVIAWMDDYSYGGNGYRRNASFKRGASKLSYSP